MQRYRFGDFELDLDDFVLRRHGEPVKLERRPLDLLALLVKRAGHLVSREEIIAALWPSNVIIDFDSGLNTLVRKARNALGDSPEAPSYIETLPGRGYRFAARVDVVAEPEPETGPPTQRWRMARIAVALSLLFVLAAGLLARFAADHEESPQRIAVLPIENLTGDDVLTDIAAGLAWETRESLALIDPARLRVVEVSARDGIDPAQLDLTVPCSLRSDQTRIVLSCRLLRVADGEQIWADSFPRELSNILGLTRELSTTIAEQIKISLSPEVAAEIDRRQTQSPEAHRLYLTGRGLWERLTPRSTLLAIASFEQATLADPDYELAWAGLAFAAMTSIRTADADPREMKPIARRALGEAQRLGGPTLAETWYAQGYYSLFGELDPGAAVQAAERAISLDPTNAQALMLLGVSLQEFDDPDAAEIMRQARVFGPNFALVFANSANVALSRGEPEEALVFARHAVAIAEEFWVGHFHGGRALAVLGDFAGALEEYAEAARLSEGHSLTYAARVSLLVRLDRIDEARMLLEEIELRAADPDRYVPRYTLGAINALLGETEEAFRWLDEAVEDVDVNLPGMANDSRLQSLRDDPRWTDLLARCNCAEQTSRSRR